MEPNYNPYQQQFKYPPQKRINAFEIASIILGAAAIVCCTCFYGSYIFGGLAILFALLSRGKQIKMSPKAKLGLILGIAAIILTTIVTIGAFIIVLEQYGSMENVIREYCNMYGYDYEEFMRELYQ